MKQSKMENKLVIINGVARAGKDSFVNFVKAINCAPIEVVNISSVDKVKDFATAIGWKGEKTDEARSFLQEAKALSDKYFDHTKNYIFDTIAKNGDDPTIFFYHVRERENIAKIKQYASQVGLECLALYIERDVETKFENKSDKDALQHFDYDIVIDNSKGKRDLYNNAEIFCSTYLDIC